MCTAGLRAVIHTVSRRPIPNICGEDRLPNESKPRLECRHGAITNGEERGSSNMSESGKGSGTRRYSADGCSYSLWYS